MKLSGIINYPLGLFGLKLSRKNKAVNNLLKDIESDSSFQSIYNKVKAFTLAGPERSFALYHAIRHIVQNNIQGDLVECGVWKGGSAMLMALTLIASGDTKRKIWLYDTFEGMTKPGAQDGEFEKAEWERLKTTGEGSEWCYSSFDEVKKNMISTGYPEEDIVMVKGKVEQSIPSVIPTKIALLRLDTDWYESTRHELVHLFPLLEKGGVLIIDDYGAWQGARKATDEYFAGKTVYLNRIDWTGRLIVKGYE